MKEEIKKEGLSWLIIGLFASTLYYLVYDSLVATQMDFILLLSGTVCLALFPTMFYFMFTLQKEVN